MSTVLNFNYQHLFSQVTHYFGSFVSEGPNSFSQRSGRDILMRIYFRRSDDLSEEQYELGASITENLFQYLELFMSFKCHIRNNRSWENILHFISKIFTSFKLPIYLLCIHPDISSIWFWFFFRFKRLVFSTFKLGLWKFFFVPHNWVEIIKQNQLFYSIFIHNFLISNKLIKKIIIIFFHYHQWKPHSIFQFSSLKIIQKKRKTY